MTTREWNLVKEAIACTRSELGNRVAPGSQDTWRNDSQKEGVKLREAIKIRAYARAAIEGDMSTMRKIGKTA